MRVRSVDCNDRFEGYLKSLTKKRYPDLEKTVREFLEDRARSGADATSQKIPGVGGGSVFKNRLRLGNMGKRKGARIIWELYTIVLTCPVMVESEVHAIQMI